LQPELATITDLRFVLPVFFADKSTSQTFSDVTACLHSRTPLNSVCLQCGCISNTSMLEKFAENVGACFQDNHFQVNKMVSKLTTTGSLLYENLDR
jgi:hypothetical protein